MERRIITSRPPDNLPELVAAAGRLRCSGLVVELECGVVRYASRQAALEGQLTDESIADTQLIAGYAWIPSGAA